jgi:hypothetical protein
VTTIITMTPPIVIIAVTAVLINIDSSEDRGNHHHGEDRGSHHHGDVHRHRGIGHHHHDDHVAPNHHGIVLGQYFTAISIMEVTAGTTITTIKRPPTRRVITATTSGISR